MKSNPLLIAGFLLFGLNTVPCAQEKSFPSKPIEIVVPSSPGGGVDLLFRLLAEELGKVTKAQVNVLNQPAGAGAIAAEKVIAARKDGYTLLGSLLGPIATMTVANPKGQVNLTRDFEPLAILYGYAAVIMLSRNDSEFKTLKDVVAQAVKKPGDLIVGIGPVGTSLALEVELLKRAAKINITSLPFAGSAQTITNLLGGHVNFAMASDVAALPHIKAGKLTGLAVDVESAVLPEVATFAKQGYPQVNLLASLAFLAPKGLPESTSKSLIDAIKKAVEDPKLRQSLKSRGYNVDLRTGGVELNKLLKEEIEKYSRFTQTSLVGSPSRLTQSLARFGDSQTDAGLSIREILMLSQGLIINAVRTAPSKRIAQSPHKVDT
jgi:tripartite-type tricarboxylate transporter receptor subunit TctC